MVLGESGVVILAGLEVDEGLNSRGTCRWLTDSKLLLRGMHGVILPDQKCSKSMRAKHGNTSNDFPINFACNHLEECTEASKFKAAMKICIFGCNYFSLTHVEISTSIEILRSM